MRSKAGVSAAFFVMALILSAGVALAQPARADEKKPAKLDPQADKVLKDFSAYIAGAKTFSFESAFVMNVSAGGRNQKHDVSHTVSVQKPDRVALVLKGGMTGGTLVSDGKTLSVAIPALQGYVVSEAPATLDKLCDQAEIHAALGPAGAVGASLLKDNPYLDIMDGVTAQQYMGVAKLGDVECHHLKLVQDEMDYEVWITTGDKPLLQKVVPDYAKALAQGQGMPKDMKVDASFSFSNWKVNEALAADTFKFTPPPGAKKADSLAKLMGNEEEPSPILGKPAPEFSLSLLGGAKVELKAHKGKDIVVLDFWATWCGPCRKSLPIIDAVAAAYKGKGVAFYAVNQDESAAVAQKYMTENKLALTVLLDPGAKTGSAYGVEGIPTTVVIDKEGVVQSVHVGYDPGMKKDLSGELDALLTGKSLLPAPAPAK